jgi:hypothetical protein
VVLAARLSRGLGGTVCPGGVLSSRLRKKSSVSFVTTGTGRPGPGDRDKRDGPDGQGPGQGATVCRASHRGYSAQALPDDACPGSRVGGRTPDPGGGGVRNRWVVGQSTLPTPTRPRPRPGSTGAPGPRTPGTGAGTRPGASCDPRHTGTGRTPGSSGDPPGPPAAAGVLLLLPEPDFLSYFSPDSARVWRTRSQEGEFASSGSRLLAGPDVTGGTEAGVAGDLTCQ